MDNQQSAFLNALYSASFSASCIDRLSFLLGEDEHGQTTFNDLNLLSHMVIAGATGTGKSTLAHAILLSLIEKSNPTQLQLLLCDAKYIEFSGYRNVPHLLAPIASDTSRIQALISWVCSETKRRLSLLSNAQHRTIDAYNNHVQTQDGIGLPHILFVIDDPAVVGLDSTAWDNLHWIAQNSRAVGIHLLLITQAPGEKHLADVIKSSIPARAVFNIFSNPDEKLLLGSTKNAYLSDVGEIIFCLMPSKTKKLIRCFPVTDSDITAVLSKYPESHHDYQIALEEPKKASEKLDGDEMLPAAVDVVLETGQASVSMLQRRLMLGYARAARIVDEMEEKGIVGPFQGSKPRTILITKEQWKAIRSLGFESPASSETFDNPVPSVSEEIDDIENVETLCDEESSEQKPQHIPIYLEIEETESTPDTTPTSAITYHPKAASAKASPDVSPTVRKIENIAFFCGCLLLLGCFFVSSESSSNRTSMFLFGTLACLTAKFRFARWLMVSIVAGASALAAIPLMWSNGSFDLSGFLTFCLLGGICIYYGRKTVRSSIFSKARRCYSSLREIDSMTGLQFEEYSAQLLRRLGYANVRVTQASGDQGIDVLAEKDGVKYAIQCKNYHNKLGNTPVQEAFAGRVHYGCDIAVVLTNSTFTDSAFELAASTGVLLWDRETLAHMITHVK